MTDKTPERDIVERLRDYAMPLAIKGIEGLSMTLAEASDTIDQLRCDLTAARTDAAEARRAGLLRGYAECRAAIAAQEGMQGWRRRILAAFDEQIALYQSQEPRK